MANTNYFQVNNANNKIIIDDKFQNCVLLGKITLEHYGSSGFEEDGQVRQRYYFDYHEQEDKPFNEFIFISLSADTTNYWYIEYCRISKTNGLAIVTVVGDDSPNTLVEAFFYGRPYELPENAEGIQVLNESGDIIFDSRYKYFKVADFYWNEIDFINTPLIDQYSIAVPDGKRYAITPIVFPACVFKRRIRRILPLYENGFIRLRMFEESSGGAANMNYPLCSVMITDVTNL